ncbi:3-hydroxyacyl-CoA dehydrogenase type-2-like isoform X2 [Venturia canescens]|uniref:3-hydroxyacyl-CoA dehydrogenase type-2-like isoform X2 n=1 Tax=Venturia canescens TaxID=32260 RepID=UPI001C9CA15C|nr:3-hydroxyacyl-CoA dehydrogenase type-2-like isoform X2 [Venturia canescens]
MRNTIAFVTGGASGIGQAVVSRIINHGGRVMIVDIDHNGKQFAESLGHRAEFVLADVTSEVEITRALSEAEKKFGGINVVINAAAIATVEDPYDFENFKPHSLESYKRIMDVNVLGTFNVMRLAAGVLAKNVPDENNQRGVIVNIASILSFDAPGGMIAYGISKAAVAGMTLPMARAFASKGIRVAAVAPGFIDTPMASSLKALCDGIFAPLDVVMLSPKRMGQPDEIAHMIQTIIENPMINAQVIRVDGGYTFVPNLNV